MNESDEFQRVLALEKAKRRVKQDALLFAGPSTIARYFWCGMYSVFQARAQESGFYRMFLQCKYQLAVRLGGSKRFPRNDIEMLGLGSNLEFSDLENAIRAGLYPPLHGDSVSDYVFVTVDGKKHALVKPGLDPLRVAQITAELDASGIPVASLEAFPDIRGNITEIVRAEKYPKAMWHFQYDSLIVVAEPDGITDEFVYEFKTLRSMAGLKNLMTTAHLQADLYGLLFGRKMKRVQILVMENNKLLTWHEPVNADRAREVLNLFIRVEHGWLPQTPKHWKCDRCEYKPTCPITPTAFNLKLWDDL